MILTLGHKFKMPSLPNFLKFEGSNGTIDLGELDPEAYEQFEKQYTKSLKDHWRKRRKNL